MKIDQLDNILRRDNPTDLYDLTKVTFTHDNTQSIDIGYYIVSDYEEMRIDLVCYSIYGNTDHVDLICSLNNIKNPLSISRGDTIVYIDVDQIPLFKLSDVNKDGIRKVISNKRKRTKIDPNRTKYLEEKGYSLPPNMTKSNYNPIKHQGSKIHIGGNIFDV